jgi:hypothetical protein
MIRLFSVAAAVAAAIWGGTVGVAPAAQAGPVNAPCTTNGCVFKNCTEAHANGRGNIPQNDPAYCASQDRDGDGYACEWSNRR